MARTYRTISVSLPPEAVSRLEALGQPSGKTAARIAAEMVLREVSMAEPIAEPQAPEGKEKMVHQCIVHERDARGMISRQHQTISLLDITRIRSQRSDVVEVLLDGEWLEIEGQLDSFRAIWESAKAGVA